LGDGPSPAERRASRDAAARTLGLATVVQAVHFSEELATGFHEEFPAAFGLPAMPLSFFVGFNLTWLAIWVVSIAGLRSARPTALFAAWFLALAAMLNGIAHPLLALQAGGYFPGLWTSPIIAAAGYWLWLRLRAATQPGG